MGIIKKQWLVALALLLLIPLVLTLGGSLLSLINPESAAGHPNYVRNFHLLSHLKTILFWALLATVAVLWLLVCFFVIRSNQRSLLWLFLAAFGPFGFAVLAMLNDCAPADSDLYARFVRNRNAFVRVAYELCTFVLIWVLAYGAMLLKRTLMIGIQAIAAGVSTAQIIDLQNASSGMWAFAEGNEVMYLVVLLYLLRPIVFNLAGRVVTSAPSLKARQ